MACPNAPQLMQQIEDVTNSLPQDRMAVGAVAEQLAYSRALVERLCAGTPAGVGDITRQLINAGMQLESTESQGFDGAEARLTEWTGSAADNFKKDYLPQLRDAYNLVKLALSDVNTLYSDYEALVSACQQDLQTVLQKYLTTLQDAQAAKDSEQTSIVLTVSYVALSFLTGTGTLALSAFAAQGALSIVQVAIAGSTEDVLTIVEGLQLALADLNTLTMRKAADLKATVDQLVEWFNEHGVHLKQVQPNPPLLIQPAPHWDPQSFGLDPMPQFPKPVDQTSLMGNAGTQGGSRSPISSRLDGATQAQTAASQNR